ncbi:hypothetical protein [Amphibiibacter pelophylacis]|uniref:Uncharacterized protein n=1 Tax=Amphibiibacter pelophylacis TaxID=1799477 RepID=A0ACC6P4E6_9BURK
MEPLEKLSNYVNSIKKTHAIPTTPNNPFPSKNDLAKSSIAQLKILIEQAEKLIANNIRFPSSNNVLDVDDRNRLIGIFISDIEQFVTIENITIENHNLAHYAQSKISDHALFHLASQTIFPKTYESIEVKSSKETFDLYSIPLKLRLALENKLKAIIGFKSSDVTCGNKVKSGTREFPVTAIIKFLKSLECLNLPCCLTDIENIYSWACKFCHTAEKEYIWMLMKAIEVNANLFLYQSQKKYEISIDTLWHDYGLSEENLLEKLISHKGLTTPIYYLKDGWTLKRIEDELNHPKNRTSRKLKFNLSETELDEAKSLYCSKTKEYF